MTDARIPLLLTLGLLSAGSARAQNPPDAPAAPDNTASAMYSLEDLYNRLDTGAAGTDPTIPANTTRTFGEPDAGPTGATMKSLNDIMALMPEVDDANGATVAEVTSGKTFWGLRSAGGWGLLTGTLDNSGLIDTSSGDAVAGDILKNKVAFVDGSAVTGTIETRTLSNSSTTVSAGYYAGTDLVTVDSDLITGNIKSGITIFGVAGNTNVVDTSSGDAVAGDILKDKVAFVDGNEVTGTIETRMLSNSSTTVSAGYYAGTDLVTVDSNLTADNIKKDTSIFGVTGTYEGGSAYPAPVPATGQTECWDESGTSINCSDTGQDGDLAKGIARPNQRFTTNNDGTVTDNFTGLIWLTKANCISTDYGSFDEDKVLGDGRVTWQHALDFVAGINAATYSCGTSNTDSDWRLPNLLEMQSLIDYGQYEPALPSEHPFSNAENDYYWTSTTRAIKPGSAWLLGVGNGFVSGNPKSFKYYVWPVRGGQ